MQTGKLGPETNAALRQLDELNYLIAEPHTESWNSNHETIELLRLCFSKFAQSPHPAAILGWLAHVQKTIFRTAALTRTAAIVYIYALGGSTE